MNIVLKTDKIIIEIFKLKGILMSILLTITTVEIRTKIN